MAFVSPGPAVTSAKARCPPRVDSLKYSAAITADTSWTTGTIGPGPARLHQVHDVPAREEEAVRIAHLQQFIAHLFREVHCSPSSARERRCTQWARLSSVLGTPTSEAAHPRRAGPAGNRSIVLLVGAECAGETVPVDARHPHPPIERDKNLAEKPSSARVWDSSRHGVAKAARIPTATPARVARVMPEAASKACPKVCPKLRSWRSPVSNSSISTIRFLAAAPGHNCLDRRRP